MSIHANAMLFWGIIYTNADELPKIDDLADEIEAGDRYWHGKTTQCKIGQYGHEDDDGPKYYVTVRDADFFTDDMNKPVEVDSLDVDPEWVPKLHAYCKRLGLPWREPKWCLVSYFG